MKKFIQKISAVLQVVLLAPVKLPGKALNIVKYIALGLGIVETVLDEKQERDENKQQAKPPDENLTLQIVPQEKKSPVHEQQTAGHVDKKEEGLDESE